MKQLNSAELTAINFEDVNKYANQDYINVFNERNKLAAQVEKMQKIINDIAQKNPEAIPEYLMMEVENNGSNN